MSYVIVKPEVVEFETLDNLQLKKHIRKGFLSSLILSKEDLVRGYIEVSGNKYCLYITDEVRVFLCIANKTDRLNTLASFQWHTNDARIVLCKVLEHKNRKNQEYKKAVCNSKTVTARKSKLDTLRKMFSINNETNNESETVS